MFFRVRDRKHRPPAPPLPVLVLATVPVLGLGPVPVLAKESLTAVATLRVRLSNWLPPENSQLTVLAAAPAETRFRPCVPAVLPVLRPSACASVALQLACATRLSYLPVFPLRASSTRPGC